jgi:hypothetical protein
VRDRGFRSRKRVDRALQLVRKDKELTTEFEKLSKTNLNSKPETEPKAELIRFSFQGLLMGRAKDWSAFLSEESKARKESPLKALAFNLNIPGLISLGGGLRKRLNLLMS